ncbi:MAG: 30S ribosomal protein S27e [Candidatus Bathyarchaeia archaeon]
MSKRDLIPKPRSIFVKVKCNRCGNEQTVFDGCSTLVKCKVCDEILAKPTGGKAEIVGEIVQILG